MRALVDLRSGEGRGVAGAFATLFGITGAHTLLETARDALFLAKLPAARLPWVYLAIAVLGLAITRWGGAAKRQVGPRRLALTLIGAAAVTVVFWVATSFRQVALLYALYVYSGLFASWVVVELWLLLGSAHTVSQAKRLFGFIGAGGVLGAVGGAATARATATYFDARHLLVAAAIVLVATAMGPVSFLPKPLDGGPREARTARTSTRPPATEASLSHTIRSLVADRYVKRILVLVLSSTVALTVGDYLFKATVAETVPKAELGAYFAGVYTVLNAVALVIQLGLVGWLFRVFGVHRALLLLPFALLGGATSVLLGGGLWAALALKAADGTLRHSLHKTSTELLYVPLPDAFRSRVKPVIDLLGQRGGQAFASLFILALVSLGADARVLASTIIVCLVVWVVVVWTIQRPYLDVFRTALKEGRIEPSAEIPELDLAALEALISALSSRKDAEVLGALDLLAAQRRQRLIPALILYHPSKAVVLRSLELFVEEGRDDYAPILERLFEHADPEVRSAAIRARAGLEHDTTFLRERLEDPSRAVAATALVILLARDDDNTMPLSADERASFREQLLTWAKERDPAVRVAVARAVELEARPCFADVLLAMPPGDVEADLAASGAMARIGDSAFIPALVEMVSFHGQADAAAEALVTFGDEALRYLDKRLANPERSMKRHLRWRLPRAIAAFPPEKAVPVLIRHLDVAPEGVVRFRILRELGKMAAGEEADEVHRQLDADVLFRVAKRTLLRVYVLIGHRRVLEQQVDGETGRRTAAHHLLITMLRDKEAHAFDRLFRTLHLIYFEEDFGRIYRGLLSGQSKVRASSRELCENVVRGDLRAPLLVLIDDDDEDTRLERAAPFYVPDACHYEDVLRELAKTPGALGGLAAYHAAELSVALASIPPPAPWAENELSRGLALRTQELIMERSNAE